MRTTDVFAPFAVESSMFEWNGRLCVLFVSRLPKFADKFTIMDFCTKEVITRVPNQNTTLNCALVDNGTLHVWGTRSVAGQTDSIMHMTTTDLTFQTWTPAVQAWVAGDPRQKLFNTSVTKNQATGQCIMAYETSEPYNGYVDFNIRFLYADTITSPWNPIGTVYGSNRYVAAPKIAINVATGKIQLFYLDIESGVFKTRCASTSDFNSWTESPYPALSPIMPDELNNVSDIEFCEFQGWLGVTYAGGNQGEVMDLKQAWYPYTLQQYLNNFGV